VRCPDLSIIPISIFPAALASSPFRLHDSRSSASGYPYARACAAQLQLEGGLVDHYTHRAAPVRSPALFIVTTQSLHISILPTALAAHCACATREHLRPDGVLAVWRAPVQLARGWPRGHCAVRGIVSSAICTISPAPVVSACLLFLCSAALHTVAPLLCCARRFDVASMRIPLLTPAGFTVACVIWRSIRKDAGFALYVLSPSLKSTSLCSHLKVDSSICSAS
jgi:hypothetical protein